jgi:hypothetical protein
MLGGTSADPDSVALKLAVVAGADELMLPAEDPEPMLPHAASVAAAVARRAQRKVFWNAFMTVSGGGWANKLRVMSRPCERRIG